MDELKLLATALGLAALAGINLYLTVFVLSVSLNAGWIVLSPEYGSLQVIGHPAILISSGIMYFLEFFADKVPWIDSMWDTIHTAIRPLGAAFLGMVVLGEAHPVGEIVAALACGSIALSTHLTKAGTRLLVNTSPEPASNSVVSVVEDLFVVGGVAFVYNYPWASLGLVALFTVLFVYFAPKLFRLIRALFTFVIALLRSLVSIGASEGPGVEMSDSERDRLPGLSRPGDRLLWALPGFAGSNSGGPALHRGHLLAFAGSEARVGWLGRRREPRWLALDQVQVRHKRRIFYHELEFADAGHKVHFRVRLGKDQGGRIDAILRDLGHAKAQDSSRQELAVAQMQA